MASLMCPRCALPHPSRLAACAGPGLQRVAVQAAADGRVPCAHAGHAGGCCRALLGGRNASAGRPPTGLTCVSCLRWKWSPNRSGAGVHQSSACTASSNLASARLLPPPSQYRMHPDIREFPSLNFYGGNLKDGPNVAQVRHGRSLAAAAAASAAAVALVVWFVDPAGAACAAAAAGSPAPRLPACAPLYARAGPHQTHLLVGAGHQAGLARLPRLPAPCVHRRQGHGAQSCTWY